MPESQGEPEMDAFDTGTTTDFANDASLLEGLFQLVVSGHTDGW